MLFYAHIYARRNRLKAQSANYQLDTKSSEICVFLARYTMAEKYPNFEALKTKGISSTNKQGNKKPTETTSGGHVWHQFR